MEHTHRQLFTIAVTKIVAKKPDSDVPKITGFQDIRIPTQNVDGTIDTDKTTKNTQEVCLHQNWVAETDGLFMTIYKCKYMNTYINGIMVRLNFQN